MSERQASSCKKSSNCVLGGYEDAIISCTVAVTTLGCEGLCLRRTRWENEGLGSCAVKPRAAQNMEEAKKENIYCIRVSHSEGPGKFARYSYMEEKDKQGTLEGEALQTALLAVYPLSLFPTLVAGDDLTLNMKPIILFHAFNINIPKSSHWCQNSCTPRLLVREFAEV